MGPSSRSGSAGIDLMPRVSARELDRLVHEQDVTCKTCSAAAEEGREHCASCHDYWTNDAPLLAEWDHERECTDEDATAA